MVTLGIDAHKRSHTAVAIDGNGRELGQRVVPATPAGHVQLLQWATRWSARTWAIEDCRHVSRRVEADLLRAGERVLRVPPKLMAGVRRGTRTSGKSDPIDALAVARVVLREPHLPTAQLDGPERDVRLLVDHRDDLVGERTRAQNRLRWHLHELLPGQPPPLRSLDRRSVLAALEHRLAVLDGTLARLACDLVRRIDELCRAINALAHELERLVCRLAPRLLALVGCGILTAAKLVAEIGDVRRFRSRAAFARHNGTAPIPVWSGDSRRVRLNRGGNRQVNAALHRIAITQLAHATPGKTYVERRQAAGNTKTEAVRALRRRVSDEVYRRLYADALATAHDQPLT
jgi:transposase